MNKLVTDLKALHEETLNNLKSSKANNTIRAYKSDFNDFGAFCSKHGFKSLPTEPKILALYLTHLSATSKFSTLKRRIASISVIHKIKGHYLDTKHPIIIENLMGIKRVKGTIQKGKKVYDNLETLFIDCFGSLAPGVNTLISFFLAPMIPFKDGYRGVFKPDWIVTLDGRVIVTH